MHRRGFESFTTVPGPVHGWRCRAKLAVRGSAAAPQLGLFQAGSHELVPIPECRWGAAFGDMNVWSDCFGQIKKMDPQRQP
jgi:hypothetical protein